MPIRGIPGSLPNYYEPYPYYYDPLAAAPYAAALAWGWYGYPGWYGGRRRGGGSYGGRGYRGWGYGGRGYGDWGRGGWGRGGGGQRGWDRGGGGRRAMGRWRRQPRRPRHGWTGGALAWVAPAAPGWPAPVGGGPGMGGGPGGPGGPGMGGPGGPAEVAGPGGGGPGMEGAARQPLAVGWVAPGWAVRVAGWADRVAADPVAAWADREAGVGKNQPRCTAPLDPARANPETHDPGKSRGRPKRPRTRPGSMRAALPTPDFHLTVAAPRFNSAPMLLYRSRTSNMCATSRETLIRQGNFPVTAH